MKSRISAVSMRGQALAEMCAALLACVPFVLLVPLLARYLDLTQTGEIASRYVAFEAIAHDPLNGRLRDDEIARDVAHRFFGNTTALIRTADAAAIEANPLWVDHRGDPLLADPARNVSVTTRAATRDPFVLARPWWHEGFDLRARNLITGSVSVALAKLPAVRPFDTLNLRIDRKTAVLVDDWSALGARDVQLRIEHAGVAVNPTHALEPIVRLTGNLPRLLTDEPLTPGLADWDLVPCDRLRGGCAP